MHHSTDQRGALPNNNYSQLMCFEIEKLPMSLV